VPSLCPLEGVNSYVQNSLSMFLLRKSSQSQRRQFPLLLFIGLTLFLLLLVGAEANQEQDDATSTNSTYLRPARGLLFGGSNGNCPPAGFRSRPTLSLDTYISALWYPQKAAPVLYAMGQSFCSVVKYTLDTSCTFLCDNLPRIDVRNRALAGSITGSLNDACLKAMIPNAKGKPAEIRVGPPQRLYTKANYWVVDAGRYRNIVAGNHTFGGFGNNDVYDWAIISGGAPTRESNGACIAGTLRQFDTRGLWIFARDPIPPVGVVQAIDDYAASLGLDTSAMIDVVHEGCTYDFLDPDERPTSS